ncbi:YdeI/OmpD-associated family protein [Pengzhenrongella sicca]|uniref:YdeI/OmpD-associated family protein n=1 Tax=Pengzhenrongella sicca TaxID=2819238 RepID=A0A8A4ZC93_9MICO|nr:YdeI/OmpD-associated family protein [Pengzhenrongella sicca]
MIVPIPFDPDDAWGHKSAHHVAGTVAGRGVRGVIESYDGGPGIVLGAAWRRDCGVRAGDQVSVILVPEGPQRGDLAPDVLEALEAEPAAGLFFDGLAQFYRKAFLTWIDATKRRPELRAPRIVEMVDLLKAGKKERPPG